MTQETHHERDIAHESVFYERCWRCRCLMPNGLVHRRVMHTGSVSGTHLGTGVGYTSLEQYETVSVCGACAADIEAAQAQRLEKGAARWAWIGRWCGVLLGIRLLHLVALPLPLGVAIMVMLARLRMVGRALLVFWVVAIVVRVLGWEPQQYPERLRTAWGVIMGGLVLWRLWTADSLPWPCGWLARKRLPTDVPSSPSTVLAKPRSGEQA